MAMAARVGDLTSQITVASDVHAWNISADGSAWLWVRGSAASPS